MSDDRFDVVVHHNGIFVQNRGLHYMNGEKSTWSCDPDRWSYFEVVNAIKEIGYVNIKGMWYAVERVLHLLLEDNGAINMVNVARRNGEVYLFVVHGVDEAEIVDGVDEEKVGNNMDEDKILYLCDAPTLAEKVGKWILRLEKMKFMVHMRFMKCRLRFVKSRFMVRLGKWMV